MLDSNRLKLCEGITICDLKNILNDLPDDMKVSCCGVDRFYIHVDSDEGYCTFDDSDLSEEY